MIHIKQIDGLRCLAIGMVLFAHFGVSRILPVSIPFGSIGVNLFFVISGFLITLILLELKDFAAKYSITDSLKVFYIRRILRIFPIYYLTIFICLLLGIYPVYKLVGWLLTYTYNFKACFGEIDSTLFSHFWSLAVEEQFYLFCPIFVLIIPKKHLLKFFTVMILLAVLSRFVINNFLSIDLRNGLVGYQLTICCFDSLGLGGLLAYFFLYFPNELENFIRQYFWLFGLTFLGFLLVELVLIPNFEGGSTFSRFLYSITCFGIIGFASLKKGFGGIIGHILENPIIMYLGKISYGIYVYHVFIGRMLPGQDGNLLGYQIENLYLRALIRITATIAVAAISWHFLELPINRLKSKFPYPKNSETV